jgi:polyphosphate kinase 2 (PPK2 family)
LKINSADFRVSASTVELHRLPTRVKAVFNSKNQYRKILQEHVESLSALQQLHYASAKYALLLIFQGMDGAGKDGAIQHVMSGVNPQGCEVFSFKQPSEEELKHDFLWRAHRDLQPFLLRRSSHCQSPSGNLAYPKSSERCARSEALLARTISLHL